MSMNCGVKCELDMFLFRDSRNYQILANYILVQVLCFRLEVLHRLTSSGANARERKADQPVVHFSATSEQILSGLVVTVNNKLFLFIRYPSTF